MASLNVISHIFFTPTFKRESVKICRDCRFYIPHKKQCTLYGTLDIVNGDVEFLHCVIARNDEYCGKEARYFEK